ncbi:PEGA domain-containing protein [Kribbella sp. NBC_00709]|uniref:PEGA domain-containing protein n=1 Tax=Kribbella sp. NBC_00709 TaxID=2975972 RepID=UPI002E2DE4F1|nr:PEGA domain-containing protein [Kribbella sp. NBC_00709]
MLEENRRPLLIGVAALAVVVVLIGSILLLRGGKETKLVVQSIPGDLTLTLDGHEIPANGEVKIKEGQHTLAGSRRGFESYSTTITATGETASYKMYLYANSAEGRQWAKTNPEQEMELEREAGKRYDEMNDRLRAKYPIMAFLPYIGDGFEATQTASKTDPTNPQAISIAIEVYGPQGKTKALQWITSSGWDPNTLDIIWTTGK